MQSVFLYKPFMLSILMLSVVMLSVIMQSIVVPVVKIGLKAKFLIIYVVNCFNFSRGNQCLHHYIQISTLLSQASFINWPKG